MAVKKQPARDLNADELRLELEATAQADLARIQSLASGDETKLAGMIMIGVSGDGSLPMAIVGMDHAAAMQVLQGAAMAVEEAALEARLGALRAARGAAV